MDTELTPTTRALARMSLTDTMTLGDILAKSGFFTDSKTAAQAVVKILAGAELGFPAIVSMTGVNIVLGKVSISAGLMGALIKRSKRYDSRIKKLDDVSCTLVFYDGGQEVYQSTFNDEDAKRAELLGKDMWRKYRKNMLFARALSNGARFVCPDLVTGVYTPEEMGLDVDGEGNAVIVSAPTTVQVEQSAVGNGHVPLFAELIADEAFRKGFWRDAKALGLTEADLHTALNVEHLREAPGTVAQVKATLEAYAVAKKAAAEKSDADDIFDTHDDAQKEAQA